MSHARTSFGKGTWSTRGTNALARLLSLSRLLVVLALNRPLVGVLGHSAGWIFILIPERLAVAALDAHWNAERADVALGVQASLVELPEPAAGGSPRRCVGVVLESQLLEEHCPTARGDCAGVELAGVEHDVGVKGRVLAALNLKEITVTVRTTAPELQV